MLINILLWSLFGLWVVGAGLAFLHWASLPKSLTRLAYYKYGLLDVLGILALIGLVVRNW